MEKDRPEGISEGIPILEQGEVFQINCSTAPQKVILIKITTDVELVEREGQEGYLWYIGPSARGIHHPYFFYSFNNKKAGESIGEAGIFLVPSHWVAEYLQRDDSDGNFFLPLPAAEILCSWLPVFKAAVHNREILRLLTEMPQPVSIADLVRLQFALDEIDRDGKRYDENDR